MEVWRPGEGLAGLAVKKERGKFRGRYRFGAFGIPPRGIGAFSGFLGLPLRLEIP